MIIIFTGNGKGKTTAALGQAIRFLGQGKKGIMIQFIKGPWLSGEDLFLSKIKTQRLKIKDTELYKGLENFYDFEIIKGGRGFVGILGDSLPRSLHKRAVQKMFNLAKKLVGKKIYDFLILDEICVAINLNLIKTKDVLELLKVVPEKVDVILTGRTCPVSLIEIADLVTQMQQIKHPFEKGKIAKRGIEY